MSKTIYTQNLDKRQLVANRVFEAPSDMVWKAWTEPELLDKWWAPKSFKAITSEFSLATGGHWFYSMNGPEGEQTWVWVDFESVNPQNDFSAHISFCDAQKAKLKEPPGSHWRVVFTPDGEHTKVVLTMTFESIEAMKTIVEMGFREGFSLACENLDSMLHS